VCKRSDTPSVSLLSFQSSRVLLACASLPAPCAACLKLLQSNMGMDLNMDMGMSISRRTANYPQRQRRGLERRTPSRRIFCSRVAHWLASGSLLISVGPACAQQRFPRHSHLPHPAISTAQRASSFSHPYRHTWTQLQHTTRLCSS
jgi:hypothetical protein